MGIKHNTKDIRFAKYPTACIDGNYSRINSFAWSNIRCDVIATASSDKSCKLFQLSSTVNSTNEFNHDTFFVDCPDSINREQLNSDGLIIGAKLLGENELNVNGPMISVVSSLTSDCFYSLSATGEVTSTKLKSETLNQIGEHKLFLFNEDSIKIRKNSKLKPVYINET